VCNKCLFTKINLLIVRSRNRSPAHIALPQPQFPSLKRHCRIVPKGRPWSYTRRVASGKSLCWDVIQCPHWLSHTSTEHPTTQVWWPALAASRKEENCADINGWRPRAFCIH